MTKTYRLFTDIYNSSLGQFEKTYIDIIVTFKNSVTTKTLLPTSGNDLYDGRITLDDLHLYIWDGTTWIDDGASDVYDELVLESIPGPIIDNITFKPGVPSFGDLPAIGNDVNDARITADTGHLYIWDGSQWVDEGDIITIDWSNITGRPGSSVSDIDLAVSKMHDSTSDNQDAIDIPFIPNGDISASNVQDAITELRDDTDIKINSLTLENISGLVDELKNQSLNILLNAFRIAIQGSLTLLNMVDSFVDEYEDQNNVNLSLSSGQMYNSTDDYYFPQVPLSAPYAHYKLNDNTASTTVIDTGTGNHNLVASDLSSNLSVSGKINQAFFFNSTYRIDASSLGNVIKTNTHGSFSFWIKTSALNPIIFSFGHSTLAKAFAIRLNNGKIQIYNVNNSPNATSSWIGSTFVDNNTWHHIVIVQTGYTGTYKVYIDGVLDSPSSTGTGGTGTMNDWIFTTNLGTSLDRFIIGGSNDASAMGNTFFPGYIDDFRYYANYDLTSDQIFRLYNSGTGSESETFTLQNITLFSSSQTTNIVPTSARIVLFEQDVDSITLNTDIKAYISRNGGTTFTQITLIDEGNYLSNARILSGTIDISAQPIGTSMVYKITTHNSKDLKIHGTGILWS